MHDNPLRWRILAVLFLARTAMGFQFQSIASVGPALVDGLHADYAVLGALIGLYMLPGVVLAVPGGLLGRRFGDRRVVVVGLACMVAGSAIVGIAHDLPVAYAGRLLGGIGAVLLNVLLAKLVADWFPPRELATAMGILVVSWPLGIGLALVVLGPLGGAHGWPTAMNASAVVCAAALLVMVAGYPARRAAPSAPADVPRAPRVRLEARERRAIALAAGAWAFYNVGYIVVVSFVPLLLASRGGSSAHAAVASSLATWPLLLTVPLGGWLADRTGRGPLILVGCILAMAAAIPLLAAASSPLVVLAAIGLLAGPPAGIIMALPGRVLSAASRHLGMGLFFACYYAAMAVLPGVAGWLRERSHVDAAPLLFASLLLVAAAACAYGFERQARRAPMPVP